MHALKAHVKNGHIILDEPTDLPEGTEVYVLPIDEEIETRLDIEEATKVLKSIKDEGETPIAIDELKRQLGL